MKAYVQSRDEKGKPTRWAVVVELGIIDGKRQRKYVYGKTRKEAEAKAAAAVGARQRGADLDKARTRLRDFLMDRWLPYQQPSLASHTYTSYKQICDLHINPDLGHLRLDELRVEHIDRLMAALRTRVNPRTKRRYADSFVVKIRAVLRAALGDAERWGFVGSNVAAKSEPVKLRKKRHKPPTDEQIRAILRAVEGHIYELVYHTLIKLGLRRGEALAIRWQDIDLDAGLVRITGSVQRQRAKGLVRQESTKTEAGDDRLLVMPPALVVMFRRHKQQLPLVKAAAAKLGKGWRNPHDLVFTTAHGTPLDGKNVLRHFRETVIPAVPGLSPATRLHDLRHANITAMISAGVDPETARERAGHSDIKVTLGVYTHTNVDLQRAAAAAIDQRFGIGNDDETDQNGPRAIGGL